MSETVDDQSGKKVKAKKEKKLKVPKPPKQKKSQLDRLADNIEKMNMGLPPVNKKRLV